MKQKIAFCLRDMKLGGVENVFINTLSELLERDKYEIHVITYACVHEPVYVKWFASHPEIHVHTLYPCRFLGTDLPHFFLWRVVLHFMRDVYRWTRRVCGAMRRFRDMDLFVDYYEFAFDKELKNMRAPKITWWHSSVNKFIGGNYVRYVKYYDLIVGLTPGFVAECENLYPQTVGKFTHIYNPVDAGALRIRAADAPKPKYKKYFVCVARLARDKDIPTVLQAFNSFWIKNKKPEVRMIFVGDGPCAQEYKLSSGKLPCAKNIVFVGALSNPYGYMRGAIANILSSHSEGLPTVLIEGAALGTLNIASNCKNGPSDILMNGRAGMLFVPGDKDGLSCCMTRAYRGGADTKKMIDTATKNLTRFDSKKIMNDIVRMFNRVIQNN